jgi:hypothetical protein
LIRHRSRTMLICAALACAALAASTAATAAEYNPAPSWKAPSPQAAPVAALVAESPRVAQASAGVSPAGAGACIAFGVVLALGVLHTNRPREKPRLWA